ncbi:MAG: TraB/GumN family protein [Chitinophagaceae bacterium]|nr:TraB/GumN family protein [Chitinophagaceae bacterium]HMN31742.1 TraB/GumN family protein [Chitinophagaceae bacterium]
MMNKNYLLFLVSLFSQLFFQNKLQAQNNDKNNSILWKVSGKKLAKPSYLFGTIHMICDQDYFFTDKMQKAFDATDKLVLEINLADMNTIMQYQQSMMLPPNKKLMNFFESEESYERFSSRFQKQIGLSTEGFQTLKPIVLLSLISQKGFQCDKTSSYEMNLIEMSKKNGNEIAGLETTMSQLKIFDDMKDSEIEALLNSSLDDMEKDNKTQAQMITYYKAQDIDHLYNLIIESKEFQNHEDALINDRNKNWAELLPEIMSERPCFVAVGAGHLSGEKGLIQLLKNKGYTVEMVK